ncbi:hypothetical protein M8818_007521 [Zalaria obscura]|uniref:Uncharacterized protein n=1 Tax=Zalaria obscura TaxID=2024903 RepID=A0ACC3S596_9PEZI
MEIERGQSAPNNFGPMCHESRFAYFTTIPVFVIQLLLLGFAVQVLLRKRGKVQHEEKGEELGTPLARQKARLKASKGGEWEARGGETTRKGGSSPANWVSRAGCWGAVEKKDPYQVPEYEMIWPQKAGVR